MITPNVFLTTIVRPALAQLGVPDANAEMLLMGTAAHESQLQATHQMGGGPALGYFQMEPVTHDDCWQNFIQFRPELKAKLMACIAPATAPNAQLMVTNSVYAAAMARVRYMRAPGAIPSDGLAIAQYWKDNYNTTMGAGTVAEFAADWNRLLKGIYAPIALPA